MTARKPTRQQFLARRLVVAITLVVVVFSVAAQITGDRSSGASDARRPSTTSAPLPGRTNVYEYTSTLSAGVAHDLARVYVPSGISNVVTVIDPVTKKIVGSFTSNGTPQHIVPSYDLRTLWVLNNRDDTVVPIDARTGQVGNPIPVRDPYNMYFTLDGSAAIVVEEFHSQLDFRDPHTMALEQSLKIPRCHGMNHADYSADGSYMLLTCEYSGSIVKIDMRTRTVVGYLSLTSPPGPSRRMMRMPDQSWALSMPQDIRLSPDGRRFFVADMMQGGVYIVDGASLRVTGFVATGVGAHSITPSHDGRLLYVANRGSAQLNGTPHGQGSVSVLDAATARVIATWQIPGGGSPDMGNLTADGKELWLSGRYDSEVYVFDTTTGQLIARIPVPPGPHGLAVWPQPGRFSLGHTGNMR
jgi:DNA-binding beta-propeller fold protein YncE